MKIKKALIVAAGLSSRLYPLTSNKPKGLLEVNGQSLLKRSITLLKNNGIEQIGIVVGYRENMIRESLGEEASYILNPFYKNCNNMGSLWFGKNFVQQDPFLYLHGDILYDEGILKTVLTESQKENLDWNINLVTDFGPVDEESMKVKIDAAGYLLESHKSISSEESAGEWIGMALIRNPATIFDEIEHALLRERLNDYDTYAFTGLAQKGDRILCSSTNGLPWIEVDFHEDYERAKGMFSHA